MRTTLVCSEARPEVKLRGLRGREDGDRDHEVSILMRVGAEERAGRAASKVSTMIIRPPQRGHCRAGEAVSASLSASARERSAEASGEASNWRARSTLRARTALAMRP